MKRKMKMKMKMKLKMMNVLFVVISAKAFYQDIAVVFVFVVVFENTLMRPGNDPKLLKEVFCSQPDTVSSTIRGSLRHRYVEIAQPQEMVD